MSLEAGMDLNARWEYFVCLCRTHVHLCLWVCMNMHQACFCPRAMCCRGCINTMSSNKWQVSRVTYCIDFHSVWEVTQINSINKIFAYRGLSVLSNELNCHLEFGENSVVNLLHRPRFLENEIRFSASIMEEESSKGKAKYFCGQNRM